MLTSPNRTFIASCTVALAIFAMYVSGLSPTITSDDSGELAGVTYTLGIAHSPGYPFYSLCGKIIQTIFPLGNPAYRANVLSALSSAVGAAAAVYFFTNISGSLPAAVLSAIAVGASSFIYNTATETEVYGLALFFLSLLLLVLSSDKIPPSQKGRLAFYLMGMAFISHYTALLWLPAVVWKIWRTNRAENRNTVKEWLTYTAFGLLGISSVIFIILRAQANPLYSWEDPRTLKRFYQVISRARYGGAGYLAQGDMNIWEPSLWVDKIKFLLRAIELNFSLGGIVCGLSGIVMSFFTKKTRKLADALFLLLLLLGSGPGFLILANVNATGPQATALLSRFLYMTAIAWCGYMAITLGNLKKIFMLLVGGFILVWAASRSISENNLRRNHFTFYDYAINILRNTPKDATIIFDRADEMEFCVSYLLRAAGKRPDIKFIDANAGVSKSIYGDDYYKIWGKPRLELRNKFEMEIINAARTTKISPVFYATFLPEQTATPKTAYGLLHYSANFTPRDIFPDEVFVIRPPENELRSMSIYRSHYLILGDYYASVSDENRMMKNLSANFYSTGQDVGAYAYHKAGFYFYKKENLIKARKIYETILRFYPKDGEAILNLGVIAEKMGEIKSARAYYKEAIEVLSNNKVGRPREKALAYYNLGVLYWKEKNYSEAAKNFEMASRLEPSNSTYRYYAMESAAKSR